MVRRSVTPAQRKRRILRDALLLAIVLIVLILRLDFPIFTANQALAATQARYFFGPGEVIAAVDSLYGSETQWLGNCDRYYILRNGTWYAACGIIRDGPFWRTGYLEAVENDPALPLVPLIVYDYSYGSVLVISNNPEIVQVEITFPISVESRDTLFSARETQKAENCFLVPYYVASGMIHLRPEDLQVKGYSADGTLLYQSPVPESWATYYELR